MQTTNHTLACRQFSQRVLSLRLEGGWNSYTMYQGIALDIQREKLMYI